MNSTHRKLEKATFGNASRKAAQRTARKLHPVHARALKLLQPTGARLSTAVSRYVQAVNILGGDWILKAAKDFARRHPARRRPRTVRHVADELIDLKVRQKSSRRDRTKRIHRTKRIQRTK